MTLTREMSSFSEKKNLILITFWFSDFLCIITEINNSKVTPNSDSVQINIFLYFLIGESYPRIIQGAVA